MYRICLAIILGLLFLVAQSADAAEESPSETPEACDPESDEHCESEEELDRGFDPCLINASLPACKSEAEGKDSAAAERTPADPDDSDGSG